MPLRALTTVWQNEMPKWAWGLAVTLIGLLVPASTSYDHIRAWILKVLPSVGVAMPIDPPYGWLIAGAITCLLAGILMVRYRVYSGTPNLIFDNLRVEDMALGHDDKHAVVAVHPIKVASISVRNELVVGSGGIQAKDANAKVSFYDFECGRKLFEIESARWPDNPKPRADSTLPGLKPRFKSEMREYTLKPNGVRATLNFAVAHPEEGCMYGFDAESQQRNLWKNERHRIVSERCAVQIEISAENLQQKTVFWLILKWIQAERTIALHPLNEAQWRRQLN